MLKKRLITVVLALLALPLLGAPQIVNNSPTTAPAVPPLVCTWVPFLCSF